MAILVSYVREDETWVKKVLVASLRHHRFNVWWDREANFPGTSYKYIASRAVRNCKAFVFVLSSTVVQTNGEAGYWEEYYEAKKRLLKLPPYQPFFFVVWKEFPLDVPSVEVRPGESLDEFGRVELWGNKDNPADYQ